jgi:hypothetical protein
MLAQLLKDIEAAKSGLTTSYTTHQGHALAGLLAEYGRHVRDKGATEKEVAQTARRCELVFTGCGFVLLRDLSAEAAARWLAAKRRAPKPDGGSGRRPATTTANR